MRLKIVSLYTELYYIFIEKSQLKGESTGAVKSLHEGFVELILEINLKK